MGEEEGEAEEEEGVGGEAEEEVGGEVNMSCTQILIGY